MSTQTTGTRAKLLPLQCVMGIWNCLSDNVEFSSFYMFKRTIKRANFANHLRYDRRIHSFLFITFVTSLSERRRYCDTRRLCVSVCPQSRDCTRVALSRDYNCDSTTIRLRYDDTTTHSTTTEVIEITICVGFDCDTTTTRLRRKIDMFIFCSRRIASNGNRHARYVVVMS